MWSELGWNSEWHSQVLGPGRFDVVDRPGRDYTYNPQVGWRVDPGGAAMCAPLPGWDAGGPVCLGR
jgi:hypothetical protein